jgi:hypothetical protein
MWKIFDGELVREEKHTHTKRKQKREETESWTAS